MLILEFKKDKNFLDVVRRKVRRFSYRIGSPITIYISEGKVMVKAPVLALDVALVYSIYLEAKEKGLKPKMYYLEEVEPELLIPDDVKKLGDNWRTRKLKTEEIQNYKNKILTGDIMERVIKAKRI